MSLPSGDFLLPFPSSSPPSLPPSLYNFLKNHFCYQRDIYHPRPSEISRVSIPTLLQEIHFLSENVLLETWTWGSTLSVPTVPARASRHAGVVGESHILGSLSVGLRTQACQPRCSPEGGVALKLAAPEGGSAQAEVCHGSPPGPHTLCVPAHLPDVQRLGL